MGKRSRAGTTTRGRHARLVGVVGVALAMGALASSCSFVVDTSVVQCEQDTDCTDRGGEFAETQCRDNVCVPIGGGACATSQECLNINDGAPAACISGKCVLLLTEECQIVEPAKNLGNDNTIYLGWMGPLVGEFQSLGVPMQQAVQLALEEIEQATNGIPGGSEGSRRKLVMVACHDLDDPDAETPEVPASERAARHLVEDVKVPLIFGPAFSGITLATATDVTIPAGVMLLSPSATSPLLTDLDDNDLVWRTAPSDAIQSIPLALLVEEVEQLIRTERMLAPTDQITVAVATKGDAYGQGLFNAIQPILEFNGKPAAENGSKFVAVSYEDPAASPNFDFAPIVGEIIASTPDIVLPLGTNEGITKVALAIEAGWPTTGGVPRPYYLFPDGGRLQELLDGIAADDTTQLLNRVQGTVPGVKGELYTNFSLRFRARWGQNPGTFAENAYDSGYLAAYSILAGDAGAVTGASMAEGMMKMSDKNGQSVDVGQNQLNSAFGILQAGGSIDFVGASGDLDFDNATGEAPADIDLWCVVINNDGDPEFVSSGRVFDAAASAISGTDNGDCMIGLGM